MTDIFKIYAADVMRNVNGNDLVLSNLRLVLKMAESFKGRGLGMEDLIQAGNVGLLDAARSFKAEKKIQFSTYACNAIRRQMIGALRLLPGSIHIPYNAHRNTKWTVNPAVRHNNVMSLNSPSLNDPQLTHAALLVAPEQDFIPKEVLAAAIRTLEPHEQFIIAQRYGLTGEPQSLAKVGAAMSPQVSRVRVRILENAALAKLRNYFERKVG